MSLAVLLTLNTTNKVRKFDLRKYQRLIIDEL